MTKTQFLTNENTPKFLILSTKSSPWSPMKKGRIWSKKAERGMVSWTYYREIELPLPYSYCSASTFVFDSGDLAVNFLFSFRISFSWFLYFFPSFSSNTFTQRPIFLWEEGLLFRGNVKLTTFFPMKAFVIRRIFISREHKLTTIFSMKAFVIRTFI